MNTVVLANPAIDEAFSLSDAGNHEGAWTVLLEEARRSPRNVDAALALWTLALRLGRAADAAPFLAGAIEEELRAGRGDAAAASWDELRREIPTASLDARALVKVAAELARRGDRAGASDALRRALLVAGRSPNPTILLRIAEGGSSVDAAIARAAALAALQRAELDPTSRARAEAIVAATSASLSRVVSARPR